MDVDPARRVSGLIRTAEAFTNNSNDPDVEASFKDMLRLMQKQKRGELTPCFLTLWFDDNPLGIIVGAIQPDLDILYETNDFTHSPYIRLHEILAGGVRVTPDIIDDILSIHVDPPSNYMYEEYHLKAEGLGALLLQNMDCVLRSAFEY